MSDTLDPVGRAGRRRLYSQALSPQQLRAGGPAAADIPTYTPGPIPRPTVDPVARRGMMAQALRAPPPAAPAAPFQSISSLGGTEAAPPLPPAEAPGAGSQTGTVPGAEDRISTRVPNDVNAEARDAPHTRKDLEVGIEAAKQDPKAWKKNADLIRTYKHIDTKGLSDDEVHEKFINHLSDNLVWLHDKIDPETRASSKRWYDGARKIAERWADEYQLHPRQVAGVLAALSPQKDWFQNVDLAKRLLDLHQKGGNIGTDDGMRTRLQQYVDATKDPNVKAAMQDHVNDIGSKALGQLKDPMQRAMWMRAYDEVHNDRSYKVVTPEGDFGSTAMNADKVRKNKKGEVTGTTPGAPQKVAWGSFKEIHKAMQALADPSLENISKHMGGNHKVRNFYNNIVSPNFGRDATVDTHAIAAANMIPAGSNHELVKAGLGLKGAKTAQTGIRGLYPHYIEAHRRAAEQISARGTPTLPRELQSITWEGIRGIYMPEQKRDEKFVKAIDDIWHSHARGEIDANTARERALGLAAPQGIRAPKHVRSGATDDAE